MVLSRTSAILLFSAFTCAAATNAAGRTFLEANMARNGVVTLPSGLQYEVLVMGRGGEHPLPDTPCSCHYEGRTAQQHPAGTVFDSSYARGEPLSFAPNQVIQGWTEAMQLMVAGDTWMLYIPSELAYGNAGAGDDIGPGDALVFKLALLELQGPGKTLTADEVRARNAMTPGAPPDPALPVVDNTSDLSWVDDPRAWHQSLARIVDHRFSTFDELYRFATDAKKAGVSALMLVEIQDTRACPGPWYNGLQLCGHINGSYPVVSGSLARWRQMLDEIKPMRLMWWVNPSYWSVQGPVWAQAAANKDSEVGRWFSWGPESCAGVRPCMGRNVVVPSVGCAQGSWASEASMSGIRSALASFGSEGYENYLVDSMANSWTGNLGIDGYCEDLNANYPCMMQTDGRGSLPSWQRIVRRVRRAQPQLVMSAEMMNSWEE
eukprot:jgi/Chrpa1/9274/Chrysochromulina_OHIO_Genome00018311-RA